MNEASTKPAAHAAGTYEICVRGHLDAHWADRLGVPGLTHAGDGTTVLHGITADQAALHGLLQRVRDLGVPLLSVTRVDPSTKQGTPE